MSLIVNTLSVRRRIAGFTSSLSLIQSHLDEDIHAVFKGHKEALPVALQELDHDLEKLVRGYLDHHNVPYSVRDGDYRVLHIDPDPRLPEALQEGLDVAVGSGDSKIQNLSLRHPLVDAALRGAVLRGELLAPQPPKALETGAPKGGGRREQLMARGRESVAHRTPRRRIGWSGIQSRIPPRS